jgi:hypothetical protein
MYGTLECQLWKSYYQDELPGMNCFNVQKNQMMLILFLDLLISH